MNKLFVVLLAVCLVSVHAFVKRDTAPAAQTNVLDSEKIGKNIASFAENVKTEFNKVIDPEKIKNDFNAFIDQLSAAAKSMGSIGADTPKA